MTHHNAEKNTLQTLIRAYERFVPREFLNFLGKKDISQISLGDQVEKDMTILLTDIRGFTSLSEELTPEQNFRFINSYLSCMEPVILAHKGIIDKYMGDAIMALFPTSADDAVACAKAMIAALHTYNTGRRRAGYNPVDIGIGLNTGLLMLGTIGGEDRMETTVIGDSVNLASRIESMTKVYGVRLLIGENTFYDLKNPRKVALRFIDRIAVKGRTQPQSVYEVFDMDPPSIREGKRATLTIFEEALAHYHFKEIDTAKSLLKKCVAINPGDKPARLYLERCEAFQRTGAHESTGELDFSVAWTSDFELGVPHIDEQHKKLFQVANELMQGIFSGKKTEAINTTIAFLDNYTVTHFRDEERLMRTYEYPFLHFQKWQHEKFMQHVAKFKEEVRSLDASNRNFILFRVQILVVDWLVNHTLRIDKHLGRFIERKEAGLIEDSDTFAY